MCQIYWGNVGGSRQHLFNREMIKNHYCPDSFNKIIVRDNELHDIDVFTNDHYIYFSTDALDGPIAFISTCTFDVVIAYRGGFLERQAESIEEALDIIERYLKNPN